VDIKASKAGRKKEGGRKVRIRKKEDISSNSL